MKICTKCGVLKDETEFSKNSRNKSGLCSACKECQRTYGRVYRAKNSHKVKEYREKNKDKLIEYRKRTFIEYQEFLNSVKTQCVKCGESRPWVIQFHHINPNDKTFEVSQKHGKKSVMNEIKKCVCLCSNCHDEFHWFYGGNPDKPVESLKEYLGDNAKNVSWEFTNKANCGKRIVELLGGE